MDRVYRCLHGLLWMMKFHGYWRIEDRHCSIQTRRMGASLPAWVLSVPPQLARVRYCSSLHKPGSDITTTTTPLLTAWLLLLHGICRHWSRQRNRNFTQLPNHNSTRHASQSTTHVARHRHTLRGRERHPYKQLELMCASMTSHDSFTNLAQLISKLDTE